MVHRPLPLLALIVALVMVAPGRSAAQGADGWALLGPRGPRPVTAIAPAPGWPDEPVILVARADDLARSRDGGASWERLATPAPDLFSFAYASLTGGGRAAFFLAGKDDEPKTLYRSADDGASWEVVLTLPSGRPSLTFSPAPAAGLGLIVSDGRLWRSRDGGAAWEEVEPAPGQRVEQAVISPDFAQDGTIFLAVVSGDFPLLLVDRPADQPSTDHEESLGVMVSNDRGESWSASSAGLEAEGIPYRHVRTLAVSPTFAQDGTLLAFAWGPRTPTTYNQAKVRSGGSALFVSRDRGASWTLLEALESGGRTSLALSPNFGADGIIVRARSTSGVTPSSSVCSVSRSADGGATWFGVITPGSYEACGTLLMVGDGDRVGAFVLKGYTWYRSSDGGATWGSFAPPYTGSGPRMTVVRSPSFARDETVLVGSTFGGVWAFGPNARETNGTFPCAAEVSGGFARVVAAEGRVRARLGCPLAPEQAVQIREGRAGTARAIATDDDATSWFEVVDSPPERWGEWKAIGAQDRPFSPSREQSLDGAIQRFEGGVLLFLPRADSRRSILVLAGAGSGEWREFPD